jgi:long-chain acyl-CoA synthetase
MTSETLVQRDQIERAIAGRTLCDDLSRAAEAHGDQPAFSDHSGNPAGEWNTVSWGETRETALHLAAGLIALGCQPGDRVALMLPNRAEHVLADLGALHAGAVPVTFYATLASAQVRYVAADCEARVAVLDGADELARWQPVLGELPQLNKIIVRDAEACPAGDLYMSWDEFASLGARAYEADPGAVSLRTSRIGAEDPVTILYTSGTTGNPKGVLLTHRAVLYAGVATEMAGNVPARPRSVSYLPLAHIAERLLTIYLPVHLGGHVSFCPDAQQLLGVVQAVQPTSFFGVPRVWEKIQAGIVAVLSGEQDEQKRSAVDRAMAAGRRYVESCQFGWSPDRATSEAFAAADREVLAPIRSLIGLGQVERTLSAAAPLPADVARFFSGLGLKILDVYGMSETTGAVTANTPDEFRIGTVGRPLPGIEIAVADDGEILTRGPLNTPGYLGLPDRSRELLGADGWLHTGDIGWLDDEGFLSVIDRKKELIITAGGQNISPAAIESLLVEHPLIGQALAFGDERPYVVALLVLDGEGAPAWAKANGIEAGSLAELTEHPKVLETVAAAVASANERLARVEQVKRWRLLPAEWTIEGEELTPTLKLKRRVVQAKYADAIDALYGG